MKASTEMWLVAIGVWVIVTVIDGLLGSGRDEVTLAMVTILAALGTVASRLEKRDVQN